MPMVGQGNPAPAPGLLSKPDKLLLCIFHPGCNLSKKPCGQTAGTFFLPQRVLSVRGKALAWCASTFAAAVRSVLPLLRRERRQYCSSAKLDFAGAENCF